MNDTRTPPTRATLTERYVQAVTRSIPESQRADVAAELRGLIADQREARIEAGEPAEPAERAVLTALGDPDTLAAGMIDRPLYLIGPRYYLDWWRLLKLLLWIVPPLAAFGIALGQTLAGAPVGAIIGSTIGGTVTVIVHLAFWTALVFFVIERSGGGVKAGGVTNPWTLDDLPEVPATRARFADMVVSLVFLVLAAAVLVWDQLFGIVFVDGRWMSFLDPGLWPWWMGGLLVLMAVEGAFQVVLYLNGRWTLALAAANTVLNMIVVLPAVWLLSQGMLLNVEFWNAVLPEPDTEKVYGILSVLTGFGIAAIAIWDTIDGYLKARRARA